MGYFLQHLYRWVILNLFNTVTQSRRAKFPISFAVFGWGHRRQIIKTCGELIQWTHGLLKTRQSYARSQSLIGRKLICRLLWTKNSQLWVLYWNFSLFICCSKGALCLLFLPSICLLCKLVTLFFLKSVLLFDYQLVYKVIRI